MQVSNMLGTAYTESRTTHQHFTATQASMQERSKVLQIRIDECCCCRASSDRASVTSHGRRPSVLASRKLPFGAYCLASSRDK